MQSRTKRPSGNPQEDQGSIRRGARFVDGPNGSRWPLGDSFFSPEHNRSLLGSLKEFIPPGAGEDMSWSEIKEKAWTEAVRERWLGSEQKAD